MPRLLRVGLSRLVVAGLLLAVVGCAAGNRIHNTTVVVQFSTEEVLHVACVPTVLPDGTPAIGQRSALLEEIAAAEGGYTLIEKVAAAWVPPGTKRVRREVNDLLLVRGPPEIALILQERLATDFQQESPFVISLPVLPAAATVSRTQQMGLEVSPEQATALEALAGPPAAAEKR